MCWWCGCAGSNGCGDCAGCAAVVDTASDGMVGWSGKVGWSTRPTNCATANLVGLPTLRYHFDVNTKPKMNLDAQSLKASKLTLFSWRKICSSSPLKPTGVGTSGEISRSFVGAYFF